MGTTEIEDVIVTTTAGASGLVRPRPAEAEKSEGSAGRTFPGGLIYTDLKDMPSLERLLAENRIASAVLWKDAGWPINPMWIVITSALAAAVAAVGVALLAVDFAGAAHPNPYVSLLLFLGGLSLLATTVIAIRHPR